MKIAYVLKRFPRFSETFIVNEILELEKQGVEVEIFALMLPPEGEMRHENLALIKAPVYYLPSKNQLKSLSISLGKPDQTTTSQNLAQLLTNSNSHFNNELFPGKKPLSVTRLYLQAFTLAILALNRGIQHFHAHFATDATGVALLASRISQISYSFTAHAKDIYHTYLSIEEDKTLLNKKIKEALFIFTVSEYNRQHLNTITEKKHVEKIFRLYNGIDQSKFTASGKKVSRQFLAIGRLVEKKGFRILVDACAHLKSKNINFKCIIVGSGPEEDNLRLQITDQQLQNQVFLPGSQTQDNLKTTISESQFMVLPCIITATGDRDGLPTVLLEAMSMSLPVISTQVAGIPEIIDDQETGILVPPNDHINLASAINRLLDDPETAQKMGKKARSKTHHLFNLSTNVSQLKQFFSLAVSGDVK